MPLMDGKLKKMSYRQSLIAALYHQGFQTQFAIRDELEERYGIGVSQATVSRDLAKLEKRWQDASIKDIAEAKRLAVDELNVIKAEVWQAWQDSIGEKVIVKETIHPDGQVEVTTTRKFETGMSNYLELYLRTFEKQAKIMGVYEKLELDWAEDLPEGIDAMETVEIFAKRLIKGSTS